MGAKYHVVPGLSGAWTVRKEGSVRARTVHMTQGAAVRAARAVLRREGGEVLIHGRDGMIRERDSYGADPRPPRG